MIEHEERAIEAIQAVAKANTFIDIAANMAPGKELDLAEEILKEVRNVQEVVDAFKDIRTSNVEVFVTPSVSDRFAVLEGTVYNQEAPVFANGKGTAFKYAGIQFHVSPDMIRVPGTTSADRLAVVIMDTESYVDAGPDYGTTSIKQTDLDMVFEGASYYGLRGIIDNARIKGLEIKGKAPIVKVED